jgi:ankyrin repeat protein
MMTCVIRDGWTAVHFAASSNYPECIQALVRTKADVNTRNKCAYLTTYIE